MTGLGQYLRMKRCAAELTLRDVADALGASHVVIGEIERGLRPCNLTRLERLAEAVPGFDVQEAQRIARGEQEPPELHFEPLGVSIARRLEHRPGMSRKELEEALTVTRILIGAEGEGHG